MKRNGAASPRKSGDVKKSASRKSASPTQQLNSVLVPDFGNASPKSTTARDDDAIIRLDGASTADLYAFSSTEVIRKLFDLYCAKYDTQFITSYTLSLMVEALCPSAPSFAKDQAQNQLQVLLGSAGLRETVELIQFVQSAGRISNQVLTENGNRELDRQAAAPIVVPFLAAAAAAPGVSDEVDDDDVDDGMLRVAGIRGTVDGRLLPSASTTVMLKMTCDEQQRKIEAQEARILELETTLKGHRPVFNAVEIHQAIEDRPDVVVKSAVKKGTIVKKGRGSVAFIGGEQDAAAIAAAATGVVPLPAGVEHAGGSGGLSLPPQPHVTPQPSRYESSREEVIASARLLAAQSRSTATTADIYSYHQARSPAALNTTWSSTGPEHAYTVGGQQTPPQRRLHNTNHHVVTGVIPALHPQLDSAGTATTTTGSLYRHLTGDVALSSSDIHRGGASGVSSPPAPHVVVPELAHAAAGRSVDVLPPSAQLLTAQELMRIVSDKRPISVQSASTFSSRYPMEQQAKAQALLDVGESSIVATIHENRALMSRLSGASHALRMERLCSTVNRPPLLAMPYTAATPAPSLSFIPSGSGYPSQRTHNAPPSPSFYRY